jgi:hypothetical protein
MESIKFLIKIKLQNAQKNIDFNQVNYFNFLTKINFENQIIDFNQIMNSLRWKLDYNLEKFCKSFKCLIEVKYNFCPKSSFIKVSFRNFKEIILYIILT